MLQTLPSRVFPQTSYVTSGIPEPRGAICICSSPVCGLGSVPPLYPTIRSLYCPVGAGSMEVHVIEAGSSPWTAKSTKHPSVTVRSPVPLGAG